MTINTDGDMSALVEYGPDHYYLVATAEFYQVLVVTQKLSGETEFASNGINIDLSFFTGLLGSKYYANFSLSLQQRLDYRHQLRHRRPRNHLGEWQQSHDGEVGGHRLSERHSLHGLLVLESDGFV